MIGNEIVIYGAGRFGRKLLAMLNDIGISAAYFCQTDVAEKDMKIDGVDVVSITQLPSDRRWIFLIAVNDVTASKQIKTTITNLFLDNAIVYECGEFIKYNLYHDSQTNYCLICNSYVDDFKPAGEKHRIFEQNHIIGGGYRENALCPFCASIDRERWIFYVLSKYTGIFWEKCRVLHFAPENGLSRRITANNKCDYYSCDAASGRAMHIVDVTDIQFADCTFDYIIINHVLEHVVKEKEAISELKRVLKPTGKIILSFPICTNKKTIEDNKITTREERLNAYGQEDHVRLYGNDFKERLQKYGLKISVYSPQTECVDIAKYGFIPDDIIMVCEI